MSPTARTLVELRRQGYLADVVERWLPQVNRNRDLFGVADVFAVHPRDGLFLQVQATTADHAADRLKRCRARPELRLWLRAGGRFEVWGWQQSGPRWQARIIALTAEDLAGVVMQAPASRRKRRGERQGGLFD